MKCIQETNMFSQNISTPKRRRLGTGRILRPHLQVFANENNTENTPINRQVTSLLCSPKRCESPPLPCNQIEYLRNSVIHSTNSSAADIPGSPDILYSSLLKNVDIQDSFVNGNTVTIKNLKNQGITKELLCEIEDISDDMFHSRLEQKSSQNHIYTLKCEKGFRTNIEETFEEINQSICGIEVKKDNRSSLFETRDSFLLDIKETAVVEAKKTNGSQKPRTVEHSNHNTFYGLPMITKGLFKTYRNIEKFYGKVGKGIDSPDSPHHYVEWIQLFITSPTAKFYIVDVQYWQEDCLNLDAIKDRLNLIYALPTSGGKTLVAEVLMLREVLNRKHNALFILPFVALVQEKIWSLSPFALQLEFLVEEYAAGKGHIPPKKRRKKNSIYIATIEKGLALVRSLIELNRLHEIGLIVVDELHLIGETGRGGTLETLLSTVIFANQGIQIVGMSATIGNLPDIARFLRAEVFQRHFRPVELTEYVKLGAVLHKITWAHGFEVVPDRQLAYDYSPAATTLDPDFLGGLVSEVVPHASCLVFCPTKRNCENVASLLCKLQRREMTSHRTQERQALENALRAEGANNELVRSVRFGVAYHHAGLAGDERSLLEQAFRSGVISVLCCTSTLAAGVNLPAQRVIIRAPYVGRQFLSLGAYRQMIGRAGRAGACDTGESIIIAGSRDWPQLRSVLGGGLSPARSMLLPSVDALILSAVALKLAINRRELRRLLDTTFLAMASEDSSGVDIKTICDDSLRSLLQSGAVEVISKTSDADMSHTTTSGNCYVYNDSELAVSKFGKAAIKGCMDLNTARQLVQDLEKASKALVLMGSLHLLYIVTPHDAVGIRLDYRHYYSLVRIISKRLYCDLEEEGMQTAKVLGFNEMNAIRMMTGKPITNVPESVLRRFYLALMLHDLWKQVPFSTVADKYCLPRGTVQSVMCSSAAFASCAQKFCEEMDHLWAFRALFGELSVRLQHCAAPELHQLMELPAVKKARALQLMRAGYKRIEDIAKASVDNLASSVAHLSKTAANHLISAARMMLIEKVENLRAEAEDVMEELNV